MSILKSDHRVPGTCLLQVLWKEQVPDPSQIRWERGKTVGLSVKVQDGRIKRKGVDQWKVS